MRTSPPFFRILTLFTTFFGFAVLCWGQASMLHVSVLDKVTGQPTPVRVHIMNEDGYVAPLPPEAIGVMYGRDDLPEGYGYQPDSSFYVDGTLPLNWTGAPTKSLYPRVLNTWTRRSSLN